MKVALIIPTMDRGGAEKQVVLLAKGLKAVGHQVAVVLLTRDGPRSQDLRSAGIPVELIGKRFKLDPTALLRLKKWLDAWQPDLVHTWLFAANSFGRVAARWSKTKVIVASERCVDPWKTWWHYAIDRRLLKFTDTITTNSEGVKDFYASQGIDPAKFCVIANGYSADQPVEPISRSEAFTQMEVSPGKKLILAVGRLWPQKRVRDLIWAGELLATLREDTTLVIIGDGPQRDELLRHRDAVSDISNVRFVGQRANVTSLLPHADAFWIASEYEGQSNAVMEAMLAGVPVVASDIPGNRDLVIDNETGRLFPVGDEALLAQLTHELLNDRPLATRLATGARERIETEFTVDQMIAKHIRLYEDLLSRDPLR